MSAESCKAPLMTINQERLASEADTDGSVNKALTGSSQDVSKTAHSVLTGGAHEPLTHAVNKPLTLSTTIKEQPSFQSNIEPWGVPTDHLWGDILRGDK